MQKFEIEGLTAAARQMTSIDLAESWSMYKSKKATQFARHRFVALELGLIAAVVVPVPCSQE